MKKLLSLVLMLLLAIVFSAGNSWAFEVKQRVARFSATCGEALAIGDLAAIKDADGYAYEADANSATIRPAVGVVGKGCSSGGSAEIITEGILSGWTSLTEGQYGYLSETASLVTQTAPSWRQPVGVAISTTEYSFNFSPVPTGTVELLGGTSHDYGAAAVDWTMTTAEGQAPYVAATNASGAVNALLPAATAGKIRTVYNNSGQVLTFKVTGQTGGTIATGKYAVYADNGTDVVEIYEQP